MVIATDEESYKVMGFANQEYASETDKFENFETIADFLRRVNPRLREITPQDVATIYLMKHLSSIIKGVSVREGMEGRYIDAMNYLRLHLGMGVEHGFNKQGPPTLAEYMGDEPSQNIVSQAAMDAAVKR